VLCHVSDHAAEVDRAIASASRDLDAPAIPRRRRDSPDLAAPAAPRVTIALRPRARVLPLADGRVELRPPTRPPRRLVATIEDLGDLIDPLRARRGVAGGGPQVDVPEPRGDLVDGDAGLEQMRRLMP
jgi:hypothetical protein